MRRAASRTTVPLLLAVCLHACSDSGGRPAAVAQPPAAAPASPALASLSEADLDPWSETILTGCLLEPAAADVPVGTTVQFERLGYFAPDTDSRPDALVFNRALTLKDTWAKVQARGGAGSPL